MILTYKVSSLKYDNVLQVLKNEFNMSDRLILKLKTAKKILLNSEPVYVSKKLSENDLLEILIDFVEDNSNIVATDIPLDILYEDDWLLIINKPPKIAIHPSCLHYDNTLSNGVKAYFDKIGLAKKIRPINRLDKDTSGIVLFAKCEYIQECLVKQMKENIFKKEYIAILQGNLAQRSGTINAPISRKPNSIIERCVSENGDSAITHYFVIENKIDMSKVQFVLETGRTHQIRVHCKYIGNPIVGDTLYGSPSNLIDRQALHSYRVSFIHPVTKEKLVIEAPIPNDMKFM